MNPLEQLKSVLCDPEGKCCITGSDEDRAIVDRALQALAQPEQEPVATIDSLEQEIYENTREFVSLNVMEWLLNRLNTTPPQRPWVGRTDEQIDTLLDLAYANDFELVRHIEATLKELNT